MEKRKLLLVAVSVGVFLVIVISAAILIFNPRSASAGAVSGPVPGNGMPSRSATADPSDMIQDPELRNLQTPSSISPIQENKIYINSDSGSELTLDRSTETGAAKTVITVPKPSSAAVPDLAAKPAVKAQPVQPAPAKKAPAPAAAAPAPAKKADTGSASKQSVSAAPVKKSYNDFWVQVGAFSTRDRADNVKKDLDDRGITAIITNQDINGATRYRVRIGPYTSKNEADYWLAMVKSIDGFEGSQIRESQVSR
jgi:DedD protein